jgi:hypothetical protein
MVDIFTLSLALSVVQLREVDLSDTKLCKEQLYTILETIVSTLSLTSLQVSSLSSLANVSSYLLSRSMSCLVRTDLQWTNLSSNS